MIYGRDAQAASCRLAFCFGFSRVWVEPIGPWTGLRLYELVSHSFLERGLLGGFGFGSGGLPRLGLGFCAKGSDANALKMRFGLRSPS